MIDKPDQHIFEQHMNDFINLCVDDSHIEFAYIFTLRVAIKDSVINTPNYPPYHRNFERNLILGVGSKTRDRLHTGKLSLEQAAGLRHIFYELLVHLVHVARRGLKKQSILKAVIHDLKEIKLAINQCMTLEDFFKIIELASDAKLPFHNISCHIHSAHCIKPSYQHITNCQ